MDAHLKLITIVRCDAQQLPDDAERQLHRVRLHQVHHFARRGGDRDVVEQLVGDRDDVGSHLLHTANGERLGHEFAQPGVVRRILLQHMLVE
ncbi:hypothetical protein [Mycobacterium rhizamassiliense]|uniref:hypothetical protein n=1 Tax=Mycobacterium rhizamassiliense TaxID=1841860 RepID=UPI001FEB0A44|nr:hypothetical protein [Mycobacterium rhizamassiliense]